MFIYGNSLTVIKNEKGILINSNNQKFLIIL
jgi:hypothetical protein